LHGTGVSAFRAPALTRDVRLNDMNGLSGHEGSCRKRCSCSTPIVIDARSAYICLKTAFRQMKRTCLYATRLMRARRRQKTFRLIVSLVPARRWQAQTRCSEDQFHSDKCSDWPEMVRMAAQPAAMAAHDGDKPGRRTGYA
jgi:hypothetical protein